MRVPEIDLDLEDRPAERKGGRKPSTAAPKRNAWESKKGTPRTGVRYVCGPEIIVVPYRQGGLYVDGLMDAWTIMARLPDRSGGTKIARAVTKADAECLCRLLNGEKPK